MNYFNSIVVAILLNVVAIVGEQIVIVSGGTIHDYTAIVTRGVSTFTTITTVRQEFDNVKTVELETETVTVTEYH